MTKAKEGIHIIEKIEEIGMPNRDNIAKLEELAGQLKAVAVSYPEVEKKAAFQICDKIAKIKSYLSGKPEIPELLYSGLNAFLIVLKNNLKLL